jgi:glycosyltransferase involved in cell wall biosynthesis
MMMSVSVVIPAYNAGAFIEDAIGSVLMQDWPADEIIIVNDGSRDQNYDSLKALASNIRVINQPNRGVSAARNVGFNAANGTYVAILDADDVWLPGKLRAQMEYLTQSPQTDAVFCLGRVWKPAAGGTTWAKPTDLNPIPQERIEIMQLHYRDWLYGLPVANPTMVVKKQVWKAMGGYDENKRFAEDTDFNLRLSRTYRVDLIRLVGMLYRKHTQNATTRLQDRNYWAEAVSSAIATFGYIDDSGVAADPARVRKYLADIHFLHGHDHFWRGRPPIARHEFWRAFKLNPLHPKTIAYLITVAVPGLAPIFRRQRHNIRRLLTSVSRVIHPGVVKPGGIEDSEDPT